MCPLRMMTAVVSRVVTVHVVEIYVLRVLVIQVSIAGIPLYFLDDKVFLLSLIRFCHAGLKPLSLFYDLELIGLRVHGSYEFLRIALFMVEPVSTGGHAVTDWREVPVGLLLITQFVKAALS
jgi:hypothetical protein